jgi:DNA-binding beta-propeller fold protein YncE
VSTQAETQRIRINYLKTIGIVNNGLNGRGFANPYDLAVSRDGRIFVLNRCDPARASAIRVGICNLDEDYLGEFGYGYGAGDGQMVWPVALAFDSQERLYITDEHNQRVSVFDTSGSFVTKWGVAGSGDGQLNGPAGIAIDQEDAVFVVDQHNHRVQKFSSSGEYLLGWGGFGSGPGQFNLPWGAAVDSQNNVYVADWRNDRVQKFTGSGEFVASYGTPGDGEGQFQRPAGVAVDPDGYIYVADWGNERVQILGASGEFQVSLRGEATVSQWAADYFASNPEEKQERDRANLVPSLPDQFSTPYHVSSQTEPYFWGPVSVSLDREDRLYVTETNRHRFQIYQRS